jgi:hypothetical protein
LKLNASDSCGKEMDPFEVTFLFAKFGQKIAQVLSFVLSMIERNGKIRKKTNKNSFCESD